MYNPSNLHIILSGFLHNSRFKSMLGTFLNSMMKFIDAQVFRGEGTNTIDSIALGQFIVALENTGLRRSGRSVQHSFICFIVASDYHTGHESFES